MRKYFRQAGYFAAILILLPYVVTILLNGRSSLAQDNGTSPYVTVKSDEKNRKISLDEYGIGILARQSEIRIFAKGKEVRRQGTENHMTT